MDEFVKCGVIAENLAFVPEGIPMYIPRVTADSSSEFSFEVAKIYGSFHGISVDQWQSRFEDWKCQNDARRSAWMEILKKGPSAIQFQTNIGSTNILSHRDGGWVLTAFDWRGPMYHSRITQEEILEINPGKEQVWVEI